MIKFEHEKQETIVDGEDGLQITRDPSIPCIEAKKVVNPQLSGFGDNNI